MQKIVDGRNSIDTSALLRIDLCYISDPGRHCTLGSPYYIFIHKYMIGINISRKTRTVLDRGPPEINPYVV